MDGWKLFEEGFNVDREVKIDHSIMYVHFIKRILKKRTNENDWEAMKIFMQKNVLHFLKYIF